MGKRKTEKVTSLWLSLILLVVFLSLPADIASLYDGCPLYGRLLYPFFHANVLHLALNTLTFLSLIFLYDISMRDMLTAYIIAVTVPGILLTTPVVGLSGLIYALLASISFKVRQRLQLQLSVAFCLAFSLLLPLSATSVHLYCYLVGFILALLNKPIRR